MAYEENISNFPIGFSGSQEFPVNNLQPILFSQIFSGTPQLYPGSTFTVEEVLEFGVLITIPEAIDIDFRWYPPKRYLGTWTLFDQVSAFGTYPEDRGFIEDFTTKIRRYSNYVVQANAGVPIAVHEQSAIDGCNFKLVSVEVGVPPVTVEGSQLFEPIAALKSRNTLTKVPLQDQPFNARIKTFGLYINAGAELTFINYKCRVINAISVDLPAFPLTTCIYSPAADCVADFQFFLSEQNALVPNPRLFASAADAEAQAVLEGIPSPSGYSIVTSNYPCSQDQSVITTYYILNVFQPSP